MAKGSAAARSGLKGRDPEVPGSGAWALDPIIHERLRLGIISALSINPVLTFAELKVLLSTTDGNLSVHARRLEEAGYVACHKKFEGRVPRTEFRLTKGGRAAFEQYLTEMEKLIQTTRSK